MLPTELLANYNAARTRVQEIEVNLKRELAQIVVSTIRNNQWKLVRDGCYWVLTPIGEAYKDIRTIFMQITGYAEDSINFDYGGAYWSLSHSGVIYLNWTDAAIFTLDNINVTEYMIEKLREELDDTQYQLTIYQNKIDSINNKIKELTNG